MSRKCPLFFQDTRLLINWSCSTSRFTNKYIFISRRTVRITYWMHNWLINIFFFMTLVITVAFNWRQWRVWLLLCRSVSCFKVKSFDKAAIRCVFFLILIVCLCHLFLLYIECLKMTLKPAFLGFKGGGGIQRYSDSTREQECRLP